MKYIFAGLSLKGLTITVDTEKLKASQDTTLANDFYEVINEKNEIQIGDLKFKYISTLDENKSNAAGEKRRKF